ncbi:MAG TPA: ABC transporter substrate-binding protein [Xanthobacteraceae bacterium]|nr:ABC transporter substrate-binding protein [Xanthobacteraceae bacterium]
MSRLSRWGSVLCLAAPLLLHPGTRAQAADTVDTAAAKQEGTVVWYTSTPIATANKIAKQFEESTGVHVELFRSGGSAILRRFMQELQGGKAAADVLTTSDPAATEALARKGTFVVFKPENFDKVPDGAKDPNGAFVAQRLNMIAIVARKDKLSESDIPKTWSDLVDPKYKGKLVTTDPSFTALGLMTVATLSKKLTWDYYKKLRGNDTMVVPGNQQVSDMLKSGERLVAAGVLDSYAAEDRKKGHPLLTIYPSEGALIIPSPTAVIKGSPHPNAAKLFAQYMLSDAAQKLFPEDGGYAARTDMPPPADSPRLSDVKSIPVNYEEIEKDSARVKRQFNEIFQ